MTAKDMIEQRIKNSGQWLAVHEFGIHGYSENCLASRCPEMVKEGRLVGRYREGKGFKEWGLPEWVKNAVPAVNFDASGQAFFA